MRPQHLVVLTVAVAGFGLWPTRARAHDEVDVGVEINAAADFEEPLAAQGSWIEVESFGRCWRPARVAEGWRPYCDGHWELTDSGWYWASDEPWAWATYHYGRWGYQPRYGWVWVPDTLWAPAWVSWREGGGYVGWAPLPPRAGLRGGSIIAADIEIAPSLFVFVGASHFHERVRPALVIVNNTTIINKTVNITRIRRVERTTTTGRREVIINDGPKAEAMSKATAHEFRAAPIQEVARQTTTPAAVTKKAARRLERQSGQVPATARQERDVRQPDAATQPPREVHPPENEPRTKHERQLPDVIRPRGEGAESRPYVVERRQQQAVPAPTTPTPGVGAPSGDGVRAPVVAPDGRKVVPPPKDTDKQTRQDEKRERKEQKKEDKQDRRDGGD